MRHGPCAKTRVTCEIWDADKRTLLVTGENLCSNAQDACPRLPGEGYEKCRSVCMQLGHAEVVAVQQAALTSVKLAGTHAVIRGHTWACRECQEALFGAGVATLAIDPLPVKLQGLCDLGVGCDRAGVCFADAMGAPEQCGRKHD